MAIVVVGGSGKDVGKTALVCAMIAALREFEWTAVKIAGHDYEGAGAEGNESRSKVWEERSPGSETDTARFLAAGARRALLVTRFGAEVPVEEIRRAIGADRNVIFESNRIVDAIKPDVCLALVGGGPEKKASFLRLLRLADAVVSVGTTIAEERPGIPRFRLQLMDRLTPEMVVWMRERLRS